MGDVGAGARRLVVPGLLVGIGFGGLVDGIVLHQVLQWHHMRTGGGAGGGEPRTTVAGLEANTLADGLFHVGALAVLVAGLVLAWRRRADARSVPPLVPAGLVAAGWGLFNLVEGLVDHQALGIHHVRDDLGGPLSWDLGFLAASAALTAAGALVAWRAATRRVDRSPIQFAAARPIHGGHGNGRSSGTRERARRPR